MTRRGIAALRRHAARVGLAALLVGLAGPASATYTIDWHSIAVGGEQLTGGPFSLRATIGQPEAGQYTAGPFTVQGGYWAALNGVYHLLGVDPGAGKGPDDDLGRPTRFALGTPHPNPVLGRTRVSFDLPQDGFVRIRIHDAAGRLVHVLVDEQFTAGRYARTWDGTDVNAHPAPAGLYYLRFESGTSVLQGRLVLLR